MNIYDVPNPIDIGTSYNNTVVLSSNGKVYGIGDNKFRQISRRSSQITQFQEIEGIKNVYYIYIIGDISMFLTVDGRLISKGYINREYSIPEEVVLIHIYKNQLFLLGKSGTIYTEDDGEVDFIPFLEDDNIIKMASTNENLYLLDANGQIISVFIDEDAGEVTMESLPQIQIIPNIIDIFADDEHLYMQNIDGEIMYIKSSVNSKPKKLDIPDIVDIVGVDRRTYFVRKNGDVYIKGNDITEIPATQYEDPELIRLPLARKLSASTNLAIISMDNKVYTWKGYTYINL